MINSNDLDTVRLAISPDDNDAMEAIDRITRAVNMDSASQSLLDRAVSVGLLSDADRTTDAEHELSAGLDAVQRVMNKWSYTTYSHEPGDLHDAILMLEDWAVAAADVLPDYMTAPEYGVQVNPLRQDDT